MQNEVKDENLKMQKTKKSVLLSENENKNLEKYLNNFKNLKSLNSNQKAILSISQLENKSVEDIKNLKELLKTEKQNEKSAKIISDRQEKERKKIDMMNDDFITSFKKAISDKKVLANLNSEMSFKQILQKMIDEKIIMNADLYSDFLKNAPDVIIEKLNQVSPNNTANSQG